MTSDYISTTQAARELGITRQRVLQLIKQDRLKAEKFANVFMIRKADLASVEDRPTGRPPKQDETASRKPNGKAKSK